MLDTPISSPPWRGAALPLPDGAFKAAGEAIGCDPDVIRAVWGVEAAGDAFEADGTLTRRFEPHHFPREYWPEIEWQGSTWRDALGVGRKDRRAMLERAAVIDLEAACRATSWGAPQIMGFNHNAAGHGTAVGMVKAFADGERAQLQGFVAFVNANALASSLRAQDWRTFAAEYNGPGKADDYARKIETAYRRLTGRASPVVVGAGVSGPDVRRLQKALRSLGYEIAVDGSFGVETSGALMAFQKSAGLAVDGLAGARTWAALEEAQAERARAQPDKVDQNLKRAQQAAGVATAATPLLEFLGGFINGLDGLPQAIVIGAIAIGGLAFVGLMIWRKVRRERRQ